MLPGLGRGRQPFCKEAPRGCPHLSPMGLSLPSLVTDSFQKNKEMERTVAGVCKGTPHTVAAQAAVRCSPPASVRVPHAQLASRVRLVGFTVPQGHHSSGAPLRMFAERRKSWPWLCPRLALSTSFPTAGETPARCMPPAPTPSAAPVGRV